MYDAHMRPSRILLVVIACAATIVIVAVMITGGFLNGHPPIPEGVQTIHGVLQRAPMSLSRRGTHTLMVNGRPLYFAESATVNLYVEEGREAQFQGLIQANTDAGALPVLFVSRVIGGREETKRLWSVPTLQLSISVPASFRGTIQGDTAVFTASGSSRQALTVARVTSGDLPFDFRVLKNATGAQLVLTPLVIGGRKAASMLDERGGEFAVYVQAPIRSSSGAVLTTRDLIALTFTLDPVEDVHTQTQNALQIARSLTLGPPPSSVRHPVSAASGTGATAAGKPCGGPAGILCPAGYSCAITDPENDIGACAAL